jgi:hypothetical protein
VLPRESKHVSQIEFVAWVTAYFHTPQIRDRFLHAVAALSTHDVEVQPMPDDNRGALVRWRPGHLLSLNDLVHAHGGRINVSR